MSSFKLDQWDVFFFWKIKIELIFKNSILKVILWTRTNEIIGFLGIKFSKKNLILFKKVKNRWIQEKRFKLKKLRINFSNFKKKKKKFKKFNLKWSYESVNSMSRMKLNHWKRVKKDATLECWNRLTIDVDND